MSQLPFLLQRLLSAVVLIAAVLSLNFLLIHAAPGDPAMVLAGEMGGASAEMLAEIRAAYGLDQSLQQQYLSYLGRTLRGDFGQSLFYNTPVVTLIVARLWPTLLLTLSALTLAVSGGIVLGLVSARQPDHPVAAAITVISLAGYAMPVFWTGLLLVLLFARIVPIFPVSGMNDVTLAAAGGWRRAFDTLHHLFLPSLTLSLVYIGIYSRLTRVGTLAALSADYVRTARAKGVPEQTIIWRHAFRNAAVPIVTLAGMQFGALLSGAILVESVFNWPGLGTLAFESVLRRDHPTLLGLLFFSTLLIIVANMLTDLSYRLLDPRVR